MRVILTLMSLMAAAAYSLAAQADGGFAALVSPPRFEVKGKPGTTVREVFELSNRSAAPAKFRVHTADFSLSPDYSVVFHDELTAG